VMATVSWPDADLLACRTCRTRHVAIRRAVRKGQQRKSLSWPDMDNRSRSRQTMEHAIDTKVGLRFVWIRPDIPIGYVFISALPAAALRVLYRVLPRFLALHEVPVVSARCKSFLKGRDGSGQDRISLASSNCYLGDLLSYSISTSILINPCPHLASSMVLS